MRGFRASERPAVTQRSLQGERSPSSASRPRSSGVVPRNGNRCLNAHGRLGFLAALTLDSASLPLSGLAGKSRAPAAYIAWLRRGMQPLAPAVTPRPCRHPLPLPSPLAPAVTPRLPGCSVGALSLDHHELLAYGLVINPPHTHSLGSTQTLPQLQGGRQQ